MGEAGHPWQVSGEPLRLDVEQDVVCPDLPILFFVNLDGADFEPSGSLVSIGLTSLWLVG